MSKRVIIFHGTDSKSSDYWYPWLGRELEARGYIAEIPNYPSINRAPIESFVDEVLQKHIFNDDTVLIGHSAGGPLILSLLERIGTSIAQAIMVAGFATPLPNGPDPVLQNSYDWERIRTRAQEFVFINSVDDPWGCDDKQGRHMFDNLGGTLVIRHDGHFGSTTNSQPYSEFSIIRETGSIDV